MSHHATGIEHDDTGPNNVAMHQDQLVSPDLGPNGADRIDVLQALARIAKKGKTFRFIETHVNLLRPSFLSGR
jgi:hypothetical protein